MISIDIHIAFADAGSGEQLIGDNRVNYLISKMSMAQS